MCALIVAWLKYSQRCWDGVHLNTSAKSETQSLSSSGLDNALCIRTYRCLVSAVNYHNFPVLYTNWTFATCMQL